MVLRCNVSNGKSDKESNCLVVRNLMQNLLILMQDEHRNYACPNCIILLFLEMKEELSLLIGL